MIHWKDQGKYRAWILLDTGYSTPLISRQLVKKLSLPCVQHEQERAIRNFTSKLVWEAGREYTCPVILQHHQHYTQEVFKVTPLEQDVDIFLPFWWIAKHPPQGAWNSEELRFETPGCTESCTKLTITKFPLSLNHTILTHPEAQVIRYVAVGATTDNPLDLVSEEFRQFLDILEKEAANALPQHSAYGHEIRLKEGEKPPWGPIYPVSETKLEMLGEYLKEMLKTGKIRQSTSSVGAPILFVSKPHGCGL